MSLSGAFYKHLMSGVYQILPFVIGGIMIALAFLIDNILGVAKDQLSNLVLTMKLLLQFKTIGGAAWFHASVLAGYIVYSIAENQVLYLVS